jgi:hypothetical protein
MSEKEIVFSIPPLRKGLRVARIEKIELRPSKFNADENSTVITFTDLNPDELGGTTYAQFLGNPNKMPSRLRELIEAFGGEKNSDGKFTSKSLIGKIGIVEFGLSENEQKKIISSYSLKHANVDVDLQNEMASAPSGKGFLCFGKCIADHETCATLCPIRMKCKWVSEPVGKDEQEDEVQKLAS